MTIILDISNYRLFKPVRSDVPVDPLKNFMKIKFMNKAKDAIKLLAILRLKSVTERIPVYFRNKEPPIISYEYTNTIARKPFNFASTFSNLDITNYLSSPHSCQCETSKFCYKLHVHVITGDLMAIESVKLRTCSKGHKYRKQNKIIWSAKKCSLNSLIFTLNGGLNGNKWISSISLNGKTGWKNWFWIIYQVWKGYLNHQNSKFLTNLMSKTP